MDIMSMLWQLGVLAAVLVFGVKLGLASGLANLSKKLFLVICICYGLGVLVISSIASLFANELIAAIYAYNTLFYVVMGIIMITAGLLTIREWKIHDKNTSMATCMVVIAPCPCCFGSITVSILMVAPVIGLGAFHLSVIVAIALIAVMVITYISANTLMKFIKKPYPVVLGNFMLFLGVYFLLSAIVIPNIVSLLEKSSQTVSIGSPSVIAACLVFVVILIAIGILLNKKMDSLLE